MPFAGPKPTLPPSAIGASQALKRNNFGDWNAIAEELLAQGYSPQDVAEATGMDLGDIPDDAPDGMDPSIDSGSPDSFGVMAQDGEEDGEPDWLNTPDEETPDGEAQPPLMPGTVEGGIDQEVDPMGRQAQAMADAVVPNARPALSVLDGGAGQRLAAEVAKQKAATPEAPPPDPARIASLLTDGASGGVPFDEMSKENPDPGFLDMLKGAGGKVKDILSALAPSEAGAQGLMAAGLGMMGAQGTYGSTTSALGQGGLAGVKTYQQAKRREDVAQAKADQLKSLEKRADQTIRMKREELDAKKSDATSKQETAREKAILSKLARLQSMAAQGNEREAREIFAQDKELQEYLHRTDMPFTRGPAWLREGSDKDPKSMDGWAANIFARMKRGEAVSPPELELLKQKIGDDDSTREAFQAMLRLQETREGQELFRHMSPDDQIQWVIDEAKVFSSAKNRATDDRLGIQDSRKPADGRYDSLGGKSKEEIRKELHGGN